jgi:hypothetical protein
VNPSALSDSLPYLLFVPLLARGLQTLWYSGVMSEDLDEADLDRETHRTVLLALAGFSFSALLALVALDRSIVEKNTPAVVALMASFLAHLFALNLQGYKARRWHEQASDALMETASLGLVLAIPAFILRSSAGAEFKWLSLFSCLAVWGTDFGIRWYIAGRTFSGLERLANARRQEKRAREEAAQSRGP